MSYPCGTSEVKSTINTIELSENTHSSSGSNILQGSSMPGGAANGTKPAGETMTPVRTKIKTRTDSLTRKYAAS